MTRAVPWFEDNVSPAAKRFAPATLRNREPILAVLRDVLPMAGDVLEIASGSGEHAMYLAAQLPALTWQPSDPEPEARASIAAWAAELALANVKAPLAIDAASPVAQWRVARADAIVCINMVHISPWQATLGLLAGAATLLPPGAPLYLYGPYRQASVPTAPSNEAFDQSLQARDARWGLRLLEDVVAAAGDAGLALDTVVPMPANNLSVIFRRATAAR